MRSRGIQSLPLAIDSSVAGARAQSVKKKMSKSPLSTNTVRTISLLVIALIIGIGVYSFRVKHFPFLTKEKASSNINVPCANNTELEELYQQLEDNQQATEQLESIYETRLNDLREKLDRYEQSGGNVSPGKDSNGNNPILENKLANLEKSQGLIIHQNIRLQSFIAETDKKQILSKYGPGPHHVEFLLDFPPNNSPPGSDNMFVIEMAPLNLMPHTVFLFLEQVTHGLLNGTSFHRNAGHVVQAGPVPYYKNPGERLLKKFRDLDLESVAFQEYHKDFPHVKYTLGYAGRPGGPDFYVSTVDNTLNHGPGGQTDYALPGEADPCFAKVIQGYEAVNRMAQMPVQTGAYRAMKDNVGIVYARLLKPANL